MSVCLNVAESINTKCNYNFRMDATYIMRKEKKQKPKKNIQNSRCDFYEEDEKDA